MQQFHEAPPIQYTTLNHVLHVLNYFSVFTLGSSLIIRTTFYFIFLKVQEWHTGMHDELALSAASSKS